MQRSIAGSRACCYDTESTQRERENFHDVGIWTRFMAPAAIVVPGQVLLDRYPGAPDRVCDSAVQLWAQAGAFLPLWRAASSAFCLRDTSSEVCAGGDRCSHLRTDA